MNSDKKFYDHKGYKMRSFTERAWARLMDALDIQYLYEPKLVQVDGCKYLPDFYLPACGMYIEVKGCHPTDEEIAKAQQAWRSTGRPVVFLVSRPEADKYGLMNCHALAPISGKYAHVSMHDLDQMYLAAAGEIEWNKALSSVRPYQDARSQVIRKIVDDLLLTIGNRNDMEQKLRGIHSLLNEEELASDHKISIAERGIKWWVENRA